MHRNAAARGSLIVSVGALFLTGASMLAGESQVKRTPTVGFATRHGKSARLSDYKPLGPIAPRPNREVPNEVMPKKGSGMSRPTSDPVAQKQFGLSQPEQQIQFEGGSEDDNAAVLGSGVVPPDTEGDVGPNHYIQYINSVVTIYDKARQHRPRPLCRKRLLGRPSSGQSLRVQNDGDPLVKYDRQADRWVFSQFALPN